MERYGLLVTDTTNQVSLGPSAKVSSDNLLKRSMYTSCVSYASNHKYMFRF